MNNWKRTYLTLAVLGLLVGCASPKRSPSNRPFLFQEDSFAYANELIWEYHFDPETDKATHSPRQPPPTYTHHCFVVARSARQFFKFARFDPSLPPTDTATYRTLARRVLRMNPAKVVPESERVVIPGYTNLYQFSRAHEDMLKEVCGGAWRSYFQRGHWRVIFPFSRRHQDKTAQRLLEALHANEAPVVHLICFPSLRINHAVLLFACRETEKGLEFAAYDPNTPAKPTTLSYDRATRSFSFPRNLYYKGGRLNVYEVYCSWLY